MSIIINTSPLHTPLINYASINFSGEHHKVSASQIAEGAAYTLLLGTGLQVLAGEPIHGWSEGIQLAMAEATKGFLGEPIANGASLAATKGLLEGPALCLGPSIGGKGIAALRRGETFDWKETAKRCGVVSSTAHVLGMGGIADTLAEYGPKDAIDYLTAKANFFAHEGFVKPLNYWVSAVSSCSHTPSILHGSLHNLFTCQLDNLYDLGRKAGDGIRNLRQKTAFKKLDPDTQEKILVLDTVLKSTNRSFIEGKSDHDLLDLDPNKDDSVTHQGNCKVVPHRKTRRSPKKKSNLD